MLKVEFMLIYLNNWLTICLVLHVIVVQQHARQVVQLTLKVLQIYWVKDTSTEIITLTITDTDGTTTTMTVLLGDFKF